MSFFKEFKKAYDAAATKNQPPPEVLRQRNIGALVLLGIVALIGGLTLIPRPEPATQPQATASPKVPTCQPSAGNINDGVKLYTDSSCTKYAGTIRGIGTGDKKGMVLVELDGSLDWKTRDAVKAQAFVFQ